MRRSALDLAGERGRVTDRLKPLLPAEVRSYAIRHIQRRHDVLEAHHALGALAAGRPAYVVAMVRAMGLSNFLAGLLWWFLTVHNRLYAPRAKFKMSERPSANHLSSSVADVS